MSFDRTPWHADPWWAELSTDGLKNELRHTNEALNQDWPGIAEGLEDDRRSICRELAQRWFGEAT